MKKMKRKIKAMFRKINVKSIAKRAAICAVAAILGFEFSAHVKASDEYVRARVVMLKNETKGQCTGESVKARSGRVVLLTAAHCESILEDGRVTATREDGSKFSAAVLYVNHVSDIMILTSDDSIGLDVAKDMGKHEHIHAITHGQGHIAYRTNGEAMEIVEITVGLFAIQNKEDLERCMKERNQYTVKIFDGVICMANMHNMISTLPVVPGSSGGAVLNDAGEVVGVVSTSAGFQYSTFVPLRNIQYALGNF